MDWIKTTCVEIHLPDNKAFISLKDVWRKGLEPIPVAIWQEVGYSLDGLPIHHRAIQDKHPCTLTPTLGVSLESPVNLTCTFLDCGGKPKYPEKAIHGTGEHADRQDLNQKPLLWGDGSNHHNTVWCQNSRKFTHLISWGKNSLADLYKRIWLIYSEQTNSCFYDNPLIIVLWWVVVEAGSYRVQVFY